MPRGRPRKSKAETGTHAADSSDIYTRPEDKAKDLAIEEREKFLKLERQQAEQAKKDNEVVDYHYELQGPKLIKKVRKASGAVYSFYVTNVKRYPGVLQEPEIKDKLKR